MSIIRAKGIPIWVTALALLIGLVGTGLGLMALFDPTSAIGYVSGADALGLTWGGRNAGLGVALLMAVAMRHAAGYTAAFAGSIFREISDIMSGGDMVIGLIIFMLIEIACLAISARAAWQDR